MYVGKQPWCIYLILNERDNSRTVWKKHSLYLCKSRFLKTVHPHKRKFTKILSLTFQGTSEGILCDKKINPFTFYAEKSAHLQPQNKNILTFSADLSRLLCAKNMSPHFYKGIQKHFYHPNFSPFTNCLQMKKKHLSLLLPIQKRFERIFFSLFLLLFQPKKKSPSLSMGLQKHFYHPKFAPFTNCLHFKPLF